MADNGIFATHKEILAKAGANVNTVLSAADAAADLLLNQFITEAESVINIMTRKNYSDTYSTLNVDVKGALKLAASTYAGMDCINYDMSGYTSRFEAETMMDVLYEKFLGAISILQDKKTEVFVDGA